VPLSIRKRSAAWTDADGRFSALTAKYVLPEGCALTPSQKDAAIQLTNMFEHGNPTQEGHQSCYLLGDGRGYTVGSIGFCTAALCGTEMAEVR
jgi:hypothetical protein